MSDLGTRIMAAGLVDDGMAVEDMERELAICKSLIASKQPVCPICCKRMTPVNYHGYYDSFSYWECECQSFPEGRKANGAYA